jgi:hypothetical protein
MLKRFSFKEKNAPNGISLFPGSEITGRHDSLSGSLQKSRRLLQVMAPAIFSGSDFTTSQHLLQFTVGHEVILGPRGSKGTVRAIPAPECRRCHPVPTFLLVTSPPCFVVTVPCQHSSTGDGRRPLSNEPVEVGRFGPVFILIRLATPHPTKDILPK